MELFPVLFEFFSGPFFTLFLLFETVSYMSVVVSFRTPEKIDSAVSLTALLRFFLTMQGNLECE